MDEPKAEIAGSPQVANASELEASATWGRLFLFGVGTLSSTVVLKIAQIQFLELLYMVQIALVVALFARSGYRGVIYRPLLRLGMLYAAFCIIAVILAVASLRFDFYMPTGLGILQYPVIVAVARAVELSLDAFGMIYLAVLFRKSDEKLRFTMRVYLWTGVASAVYGLLSFPLLKAGVGQFGAYGHGRLRGFYNEGGPYGIYAVTLYYVGIALYRRLWEPKLRVWVAMGLISIALVLSASKAAFLMLLALVALNALLAQGIGKRITILGAGAVVAFAFMSNVDIGRQLRLYQQQGERYERLSRLHAKDGNFVQGRVAGVFIVPRMISAHPITGVGWGNYGIVRNDPQYRGASAWGDLNDEPGLGFFSMAAETGLPLLLLLFVCMTLPYFYARRSKAPAYVANLALVQPIAHVFGAQLNLTYPWIVTAFAMGLAFSYSKSLGPGTSKPSTGNEETLGKARLAGRQSGLTSSGEMEGSYV